MEISPSSISIYDNITKSEERFVSQNLTLDITTKWDYVPKVQVHGRSVPGENVSFKVVMLENGKQVYQAEVYPGMFALGYRRWVSDYEIQVWDSKGGKIFDWKLFERMRMHKTLVSFDSSSLGDTIAWLPYVEEFRKTYKVKDLIVTTFWNQLFEDEYPNIRFQHPGYRETDLDIIIPVGWFDEADRHHHPVDPRTVPLQKTCADILQTPYSGEIRPLIKKTIKERPTDKPYVCIATESTAGAKYWHYPGGWQRLVDLLKKLGYEVVVIQRGSTDLKGVIDRTGANPIEERISEILQCEFFIGLGSGLSWLSWALEKPTVLISGFSQPFMEFSDKTLRIINKNVCHGCFNDPAHKFDRGDWWWCPVHKGTERAFECTKTIKPEEILIQILDWLPARSI